MMAAPARGANPGPRITPSCPLLHTTSAQAPPAWPEAASEAAANHTGDGQPVPTQSPPAAASPGLKPEDELSPAVTDNSTNIANSSASGPAASSNSTLPEPPGGGSSDAADEGGASLGVRATVAGDLGTLNDHMTDLLRGWRQAEFGNEEM